MMSSISGDDARSGSGGAGDASRRRVWLAHGATEAEADELMAYAAAPPLPAETLHARVGSDAPFVAAWESYVRDASEIGAYESLRRRLVQLRFPIAEGISDSQAYKDATCRGLATDPDSGVVLDRPDSLTMFLHPTPAGRVPVIVAEEREDFVRLVQALACRNEPKAVPRSMGACIVSGYNNWARIMDLRRAWEEKRDGREEQATWAEVFHSIVPRKELYQDRFILLSSGPYSGVAAEQVGVGAEEWSTLSLRIRLEHECTHYYTKQAFGVMRNAILDELVADYVGIVSATGAFRADWLLCFLGLEGFPAYRTGGRLENYRGQPPLSAGAFTALGRVAKTAAEELEAFDRRRTGCFDVVEKARVISTLMTLGVEQLVAEGGDSVCARCCARCDDRPAGLDSGGRPEKNGARLLPDTLNGPTGQEDRLLALATPKVGRLAQRNSAIEMEA